MTRKSIYRGNSKLLGEVLQVMESPWGEGDTGNSTAGGYLFEDNEVALQAGKFGRNWS